LVTRADNVIGGAVCLAPSDARVQMTTRFEWVHDQPGPIAEPKVILRGSVVLTTTGEFGVVPAADGLALVAVRV
jgi:hypothetical protein